MSNQQCSLLYKTEARSLLITMSTETFWILSRYVGVSVIAENASHAKPTRPQTAAQTGALVNTFFTGSGGAFSEVSFLTSMLAAMYIFSAWENYNDDLILWHKSLFVAVSTSKYAIRKYSNIK